jgi:hypothetical protein
MKIRLKWVYLKMQQPQKWCVIIIVHVKVQQLELYCPISERSKMEINGEVLYVFLQGDTSSRNGATRLYNLVQMTRPIWDLDVPSACCLIRTAFWILLGRHHN